MQSKEVVTAVKFLVENGDYDYVLSGSLLGIELNDIRSWPVGYLSEIEMFPLDFEEFCWAIGLAGETVNGARQDRRARRDSRLPARPDDGAFLRLPRKFKLFCSDVGMLSEACGMNTVRSLIADRSDVNYGAVYENFVAQQLKAHGRSLFYFSNRSIGELDFLLEDGLSRIVPVEVKSGKNYRRHSALDNALATPNYGIDSAIVLHDGSIDRCDKVDYLPIYAAAFL